MRTTDYGATWSTVLPDFSIDGESITVYPSNPDTIYAGNFPDGALYLSTDRGATWSARGISSNRLCALAVKPDDPLLLCAGTGGGTISRTTNVAGTRSIVKPVTAGGTSQEVPFIASHPSNPARIRHPLFRGRRHLGHLEIDERGRHVDETASNNSAPGARPRSHR